jgi:S1-C subfamily serine protease
MPDYLFGGEGMRIDGTREGRPAAIAGLKQGDIVIKIGEHAVKDMTGYMEALSKFEKGQTTEITFIRDGKEEKCTVTW